MGRRRGIRALSQGQTLVGMRMKERPHLAALGRLVPGWPLAGDRGHRESLLLRPLTLARPSSRLVAGWKF